MSQLRDERDDMLFLWFALLVLIFVVIPALYAAHKGSVNAPLVWLASLWTFVRASPLVIRSTLPQTVWLGLAMRSPAFWAFCLLVRTSPCMF